MIIIYLEFQLIKIISIFFIIAKLQYLYRFFLSNIYYNYSNFYNKTITVFECDYDFKVCNFYKCNINKIIKKNLAATLESDLYLKTEIVYN